MKYIYYLKVLFLSIMLGQASNAQVIKATDYVLESQGDAKFTKAIQAAVIKASSQTNGQVFIGEYQGQSTLPITPIKFYDFNIDNICYNLSNYFNLDCSHMLPGNDGLIDLKNLTITIDCGITIEALTCYFKGFDEMLGFNGFKNFTINGYGATFTMQGFEWYKTLSEINHDNAYAYQNQLAACAESIPDFCTTTSNAWQNTRNCRKESTACLECWTGNHHPSTGPQENFAQGRHGIHLANCHNVRIEGIAFDQIYSDGINLDPGLDQYYRWKHALPSRNITIKDCSFTNCGRVGVCCCSVNSALITNCAFENNGYIIAGVDIDIEPFNELHSALDINIQHCSFKGAANTAISIGPGGMTQKDLNDRVIESPNQKIDVSIQNCVIEETEFAMHHAGGPYLPHPYDQVQVNKVTIKKLGHEYGPCVSLPANKIQACKDSLDNFVRIGLLFDSRLTPKLVGDWTLWDVNNLVMKEVSTETNGHQFTWHSMPFFIRTSHFLDYFLNNRLGCAEDLTECPNYTAGGFVYDELFGGLSLNNIILYDNHGNTTPNVRASKPIARQEFCIVKSQRFDNAYFLPRFANVKSNNVIKVNPQNVEGYRSVFNANSFDCDLVGSTYSDDFEMHTSVIKPAVSIGESNSSIYEGGIAYFTISLSQAVNYPVSVDYELKGNATNRLDYSYLTGNIVVPPNTYETTLAVEIIKDCVSEYNNEKLEITLLTDKDETYTLQQKTAKTSILDIDCATGLTKNSCQQNIIDDENNEEEETEQTNDNSNTGSNINSNNTLGFNVKGGNTNTTTEETDTEINGQSTSICKDQTIFTDYPWLNQLINKSNCKFEKITIYSGGGYTFVFIEDENTEQLYYQDGTYFCSETVGFDCLTYYKSTYNLTETNCWICTKEASDCFISGCMTGNACNFNPDACIDDGSCNFGELACENPCNCSENNDHVALFNQYPMLYDLVDLNNCAGTIIELFEYNAYAYIAITNINGTNLYVDYLGSDPYCSSTVKYYCKDIYNLSSPTRIWQCKSNFAKLSFNETSGGLKFNYSKHQIFPNPNKGVFYVSFNSNNDLPVNVKVYSASGAFIKSMLVRENVLKIDISEYRNGLYFIETNYQNYSGIEKVILQR